MTQYRIVPATLDHVAEILPNLRQIDRIEGEIATGMPAEEALRLSVQLSYEAIAGFADGKLIAIAGVAPVSVMSSVARPWMVGTDELPKHAMRFCRENRKYIKRWLEVFSRLENYVDAENTVAIGWLKWLGFELEKPVPWGDSGHEFIYFHQEVRPCAKPSQWD